MHHPLSGVSVFAYTVSFARNSYSSSACLANCYYSLRLSLWNLHWNTRQAPILGSLKPLWPLHVGLPQSPFSNLGNHTKVLSVSQMHIFHLLDLGLHRSLSVETVWFNKFLRALGSFWEAFPRPDLVVPTHPHTAPSTSHFKALHMLIFIASVIWLPHLTDKSARTVTSCCPPSSSLSLSPAGCRTQMPSKSSLNECVCVSYSSMLHIIWAIADE